MMITVDEDDAGACSVSGWVFNGQCRNWCEDDAHGIFPDDWSAQQGRKSEGVEIGGKTALEVKHAQPERNATDGR